MSLTASARAQRTIAFAASATIVGIALSVLGASAVGAPLTTLAMVLFGAGLHALGRSGPDEG